MGHLSYLKPEEGTNLSQEQVNNIFQITIMIHEHDWFGENKKRRNRDEVQEWVAKQIAKSMGVYTVPCGGSWGVVTNKEHFDKYWEENSKIK